MRTGSANNAKGIAVPELEVSIDHSIQSSDDQTEPPLPWTKSRLALRHIQTTQLHIAQRGLKSPNHRDCKAHSGRSALVGTPVNKSSDTAACATTGVLVQVLTVGSEHDVPQGCRLELLLQQLDSHAGRIGEEGRGGLPCDGRHGRCGGPVPRPSPGLLERSAAGRASCDTGAQERCKQGLQPPSAAHRPPGPRCAMASPPIRATSVAAIEGALRAAIDVVQRRSACDARLAIVCRVESGRGAVGPGFGGRSLPYRGGGGGTKYSGEGGGRGRAKYCSPAPARTWVPAGLGLGQRWRAKA